MSTQLDRFETRPRDAGGRVVGGWRVTRYSWGHATIQHLRSGASQTGVVDCYGNVVPVDFRIIRWTMETEELVPFYK